MRTANDLPENIRKHFDMYDLIGVYKPPGTVTDNGSTSEAQGWVDGGDSCHFTGIYYYCFWLNPEFRFRPEYYGNIIGRLAAAEGNLRSKSAFGGYKRHPDSRYWYSDDNRMSRDQATPLLASLAISNSKKSLARQLLHHAKRLFLFSTNTRRNGTTADNHGMEYAPGRVYDYSWKVPDLMIFDIWSIFIRGLNLKLLYPLLLVADLQTYINARILLRNPTDTDVANFFIKHSLSRKLLPTFIGAWTDSLLKRLNLEARIAVRYSAPGMPVFLGRILQDTITKFRRALEN